MIAKCVLPRAGAATVYANMQLDGQRLLRTVLATSLPCRQFTLVFADIQILQIEMPQIVPSEVSFGPSLNVFDLLCQ
jgi:hypothetical protein